MIYFAFVHPHLLYGIEIYANTSSKQLTNLMVLNNKLLRILQQKAIRTHSVDLYKSYFTLPIPALHTFQILIFMHNFVYNRNKLPEVFSTYIDENKLIHEYNTRQKNDFHIFSVRTETGKRNLKYKGSLLWNNLPSELKNTESTKLIESCE